VTEGKAKNRNKIAATSRRGRANRAAKGAFTGSVPQRVNAGLGIVKAMKIIWTVRLDRERIPSSSERWRCNAKKEKGAVSRPVQM